MKRFVVIGLGNFGASVAEVLYAHGQDVTAVDVNPDAVDRICTYDVLVHTWDLARATGLDETLDPEEVHRYVSGMEEADVAMRQSGHYGPRVPVPDDADQQTRLIAFTGRRP